jgi:hypothetical protein
MANYCRAGIKSLRGTASVIKKPPVYFKRNKFICGLFFDTPPSVDI